MNVLVDNEFQEVFSKAWGEWKVKLQQEGTASKTTNEFSSAVTTGSPAVFNPFGSSISKAVTTTAATSNFFSPGSSSGFGGLAEEITATYTVRPKSPFGSTIRRIPKTTSANISSGGFGGFAPVTTTFVLPSTATTASSTPLVVSVFGGNSSSTLGADQMPIVQDSGKRSSKKKPSSLEPGKASNHMQIDAILNMDISLLFNNGRYEDCIKCIEYVPNFYSNRVYVEYLIKSYVAINDILSARSVTNMYVEMQSTEKDKDEVKNWSDPMLEKIKNQQLYLVEEFSLHNLQSPNPWFRSLSDKIELSHNATDGYGMTALKKIEVGETILCEKPYASTGRAKCTHCFLDTFLRTACSVCKCMQYCTNQCKDDDKKTHKWVCSFFKSKRSNNVKLALSVFLNALKMDFKDALQELKFLNPSNDFSNFLLLAENFKLESNLLDDLAEDSCTLTAYIINEPDLFSQVKLHTSELELADDKVTELVGQILLRLLVVCEIKRFVIFDNVLGATYELFPFFSLFQNNCEPNTIVCRVQDKVILKALKDIPSGANVTCSYFEMANTTYRQILCDRNRLSGLNQRCSYSCQCFKGLHKPLDNCNMHIGATNTGKMSHGLFKAQLQMKISEINKSLSNKNSWNVEKTFQLVKEINLDTNHLIFQLACFEVIELKLYTNELNDLEKYLPIIMNIDKVQYFKQNHISLYLILKQKMVSLLFHVDFPESLLKALISYMDFLKWFVETAYPNQVLIRDVEIMYSFYRRQAGHANDNGLMNALEA